MGLRERKQTELWAQIGFYTSLGFIVPGGAVAGYALGWYLDRGLHTTPVLAVVMAFLGGVGGFIEVLRLLTRAEKRAGGNDTSTGPGPS